MLIATMVIALAGATGTIGKATIKRLIQRGYTVRPFSRQELASAQACKQALGLEARKAGGHVKAVISCMA